MSQKSNNSRTLVNIMGIPSILFSIFLGDNSNIGIPFYSTMILLIMILSVYEWNNLTRSQCFYIDCLNFVSICSLFLIIFLLKSMSMVAIFLLVHILIGSLITTFGASQKPLTILSNSIFGVIFIGICIGSLIIIRNFDYGLNITLMMFISIWICDTFAFYFGKKFGKRKLSPHLSPNKTWFGAISGFFGCSFTVLIFYIFFPIYDFNLLDYFVFSLIFGFLGQIGDLLESSFKREVNIKDTSNILQGHGGIMDRFDSLSFSSPALYLYLIFKYIL